MREVIVVLAACTFILGGSSSFAQEICGGITGTPCDDPGEFCRLVDGECCCDFQGVCTSIPEACPTVYEPVCGCDGVTYSNRCEAERASMSLAHPCACDAAGTPGSTVVVTGFAKNGRLYWDPFSEAYAYNVYIDRDVTPALHPACVYGAVPESSVLLQGTPAAGGIWMFLVSPLTPAGEGSLGVASGCKPRGTSVPCTCTLPADEGPCDGVCPRWFHNAATGRCEEFIWGCCGGNANNFPTAGECAAACQDPCSLPALQGECDAAIPRWYHNVLTGACETFTWGGCGGNANNFENEASCQSACIDACLLPADPGPCDGVCPRWFHNAETGQCEKFIWGCCGGNANNFPTADACTAACPEP